MISGDPRRPGRPGRPRGPAGRLRGGAGRGRHRAPAGPGDRPSPGACRRDARGRAAAGPPDAADRGLRRVGRDGAGRAARRCAGPGCDVPGRVSLIGFDDHEMAPAGDLTTVAQPVRRQGELAARLLMDVLAGGEQDRRRAAAADPAGGPRQRPGRRGRRCPVDWQRSPLASGHGRHAGRRPGSAPVDCALLAGAASPDAARAPLACGTHGSAALGGRGVPARLEQVHLDVVEPLDVLYGDRHRPRRAGRAACSASCSTRPRPGRAAAACWTGAARSTRAGSSAPGWSATSATPTASAAPWTACASGSTTSPSSASRTCTSCRCCSRAQGENDGGYAVADYRARRPAAGHHGRPGGRSPPTLHGRGMSLCVDLVLNHTAARARVGAGARGRATRRTADFYLAFPDRDDARRVRAHAARGLPGHRAGQLHLGPGDWARWVWTTFHDYQWDLDYSQPRGLRGDARRRCSGWPTAGWTCSGWTRCRSCGSGWAPTARTSPRRTCCCRRSAR